MQGNVGKDRDGVDQGWFSFCAHRSPGATPNWPIILAMPMYQSGSTVEMQVTVKGVLNCIVVYREHFLAQG